MARPECCEIHGGKIIVFGDLHISSTFMGQHKNYQLECFENMELIIDTIKSEKASAVIFLGDIIGVNEKTIRDRQYLMRILHDFKTINSLVNGNVFSVKGNHDMGDFTDFDFFLGMGLFKNPKYIDYYGIDDVGNESHEVRFHLVNYGDEHKELEIAHGGTASNVVLGHAEYYIEGVTNWYSANSDLEVSTLDNFQGVSLIFSGHIHIPSDEVLYTTFKDGTDVGLFFPGSPSRVADRYDKCYYMTFNYMNDDGEWSTVYASPLMNLRPASEIFYPEDEIVNIDEDVAERIDASARLTDIVKEIMESRIVAGDLNHQIDAMVGVSDEVKGIAKKYLEEATTLCNK